MDKGICLYDLQPNGCLNGVYTNNSVDGEIFNEIARKHTDVGDDELCGYYNCFYFDKDGKQNSRHNAELHIVIKNGTTGTYQFVWTKNKSAVFEGIGYKMNDRQVAVHYWDKEE